MLPDDVLLEIINFSVPKNYYENHIVKWIRLAHVCRRWRRLIFQSPRRLNLRLVCTRSTPARDTLDIWPPLPLIIHDIEKKPSDMDNIIAALEHNNRVYRIILSSSEIGFVTNSAAMQRPFPELTDLVLRNYGNKLESVIPNSFVGETAPRLQSLILHRVPFPGLPKLLLSATHLVKLDICCIPHLGYIPPESMATCLSALTSLESLRLYLNHPPPRPAPESRYPPPHSLTRSILPSLTKIRFQGTGDYLEVILARIDAPRLDDLDIAFFNQLIFDTPQLSQFISRRSTFMALEEAHIEFCYRTVTVEFPSQTSYGKLKVEIRCSVLEWQISSLEQVCTSSLPPVSTLKDLYINGGSLGRRGQDDVENVGWLELLRPFAAVKNLYIHKKFVPGIAPALQELVGGRTTEALPALENLFLDGLLKWRPLHEGIKKFVAARGLTNHPVAFSCWDSYRE